jgi:hypothetical protein
MRKNRLTGRPEAWAAARAIGMVDPPMNIIGHLTDVIMFMDLSNLKSYVTLF